MTVFTAAAAPRIPQITGQLISGGKVSLASYRGHVLVLNFWGSWCTVCREEAPALAATVQRFHATAVRFLGVDVEDNAASAKAYMRDFKLNYPSISDPGDQVAAHFSKIIPDAAFPSTIVITPSGHIIGRVIGRVSSRELINLIHKAET
jgi:peroxiredoxin